MVFYGAGDHGGGPAKENIQSILDMQKQTGAPTILFSTPDQYFEEIVGAVREPPLQTLPVVADDLQHHSVGCYTAMSEIKKDNRTAEAGLATGEKMAALASVLAGLDYPKSEFTAAWKKVLFMQFHDSMAGTALPEQYVVSRHAYGYAQEVANQAINLAAQKIAWQIPTQDPQSEYLVVFNPHAWDAALNVEYDLGWGFDYSAAGPQGNSRLEDEHGDSLPHQWTQASTIVDDRVKLVFPRLGSGIRLPAVPFAQGPAYRAACLQPYTPPRRNWKMSIFVSPSGRMAASRFSTRTPAHKFSEAARAARAPSYWTTPAIPGAMTYAPTRRRSGPSGTPVSGCLKMVPCAPQFVCGRATDRLPLGPTGCSTPGPGRWRRAWRWIGTSTLKC